MKKYIEQIKNLPRARKQQILIIAFIGIAIVTGLLILNKNFKWSSSQSTVTIIAPLNETVVYTEDKIVGIIANEGDSLKKSFSSGDKLILVHKEGFWPWKKDLQLENGASVILKPFILPMNVTVRMIPPISEEHTLINSKFSKRNGNYEITSKDGSAKVSVSTNAITTKSDSGTCVETCTTLRSETPIRNVEFYGDRNDVLIVAMNNGIFALETSPENTQNIQPFYIGGLESTFFYSITENIIYVSDSGDLFELIQ